MINNNNNIFNVTEEMNLINFDSENINACVDGNELYLKDIGKVKLLTEEEEKALGMRILAGEKAKEALKAGVTDKAIRDMVSDGEAAQKTLIESNLRLVVSIAKQFNNSKIDFMDLVQEGNIGLTTAARKFDVTKGYRFTTYATHWIRQAMQRALANKGNVVRIPNHMVQRICNINKTKRTLANLLGREATNEEIAKALDLSEKQVEQALIYSLEAASLDATVADDSEATLGDLIADENCASPEEKAVQGSISEVVAKALDSLPKKEAEILRYRFGFYGETRTLEEVGEIFGVTRERIRQIENKALASLKRKKDVMRDLSDYYYAV